MMREKMMKKEKVMRKKMVREKETMVMMKGIEKKVKKIKWEYVIKHNVDYDGY